MLREFLKKNIWLVNLIAIGLVAWMAGAVAAEVSGSVLSDVQKKTGPIHFRTPATLSANNHGEDILQTLGDRNPFNADRPKPEDDSKNDDDSAQDGTANSGPMDAADLGMQLIGVLYSQKPEWSMATIKTGADTKLVREGVMVMNDTAVVSRIAPRYIVITKGKADYVLRLWAKKDNKAKHAPPRRFGSIGRPRTAGPMPSYRRKNYSKGVRKVGPYEYQVDRDMLMQSLQNLSALGMQARIIPNYRNGHYEGFRLVGVRSNSLYSALGIRSGDVIKRVNGTELNSPNKALELFNQLQNNSSIAMDLTRYGKNITMNYKVK